MQDATGIGESSCSVVYLYTSLLAFDSYRTVVFDVAMDLGRPWEATAQNGLGVGYIT